MIGLDTNIVVRVFADDDARQRAAATRLIDGLPAGDKAVVNLVVLVELLLTLRSVYEFDREQLAIVVTRLSEHPKIQLLETYIARDAVHRSGEIGGDIADHFIASPNRAHGCEVTYTFDHAAANSPDFALLKT
jgi:predicted nucleic-acid-binding protein